MESVIECGRLNGLIHRWKIEGKSIGFVPTMGALHSGHLNLVHQAKSQCDVVIVSIFVNPKQFGPNEDFSKYPRTLAADLDLLRGNADCVFIPNTAEIFPDGFSTKISNTSDESQILCGAHRPGHFDGVLTVVNKLLNLTQADKAFFGKKDYQQLFLVKKMVADLGIQTQIIGVDTVRESDGLALSSRNRYLSPEQRQLSLTIFAALNVVIESYNSGIRMSAKLEDLAKAKLSEIGEEHTSVDYVEVRRQNDLKRFDNEIDQPAVVLIAIRLGTTRLIDNMEFALS